MISSDIGVGLITVEASGWTGGCDTLKNPWLLNSSQYRFGINIINRGGIPQTRPGRALRLILPPGNLQGGAIFHATKRVQIEGQSVPLDDYYFVIVVDGFVYAVPFSNSGTIEQPLNWRLLQLPGVRLDKDVPMVHLISVERAARRVNGVIEVVFPHHVLVIQDGKSGAVCWDGEVIAQETPPTTDAQRLIYAGVPTGTWMAQSGDRLWVATSQGVMASDLKDPLSFHERLVGDTRGDFTFGGDVTGLVDYHDSSQQAVLTVFTATTRSVLMSGVRNRTLWPSVDGGFQRLLDPSVGCVSGRSIVVQGGLLSWWSAGGMVSVDPAMQRYHTDEVPYQDVAMARTKSGMPSDASGVCAASYERFLLMSVPFQEALNSHTMVLDFGLRTPDYPTTWCGVWTGTRPVQWVTAVVHGVPRVFQLSIDYQSLNNGSHLHVWEEFCNESNDVYFRLNSDSTLTQYRRRIYCYFESALLGPGMDYKELKFVEFDLTKIAGDVDLRVSYRSQRGETDTLLRTSIRALYFDYQLEGQDSVAQRIKALGKRLSQSRRLRTQEVNREQSKQAGNPFPTNVDRAFSIVFEWCGQAGLDAMSVVMMPHAEGAVGETVSESTDAVVVAESGSMSVELARIGVEDQPVSEKERSWVATQTAVFSTTCTAESITPNLAVSAEVTYRSYISADDARARALELATQRAEQEAEQLRNQNPCTWQSFRYADRVCRPQLNDSVTGLAYNPTTLFGVDGVAARHHYLVGRFTQNRSTVLNGIARINYYNGKVLSDTFTGARFSAPMIRWAAAVGSAPGPGSPRTLVVANESTGSSYSGVSTPAVALFSIGPGVAQLNPVFESARVAAVGAGPSGHATSIAINALVANETTSSLTSNGLSVYLFGEFTSFSGASKNCGVCINPSTGAVTAFDLSYPTKTIVSARGGLLTPTALYAVVVLADSSSLMRLIRVDAATGAYDATFSDVTFAIASSDLRLRPHLSYDSLGRIYLGYNDTVVRVLPTGSIDSTFPTFTVAPGRVITAVQVGGADSENVYVSTSSSPSPSSTGSGQLIKVNLSGVSIGSWSVTANGTILGSKIASDYVAIFGDFTEVNGKPLSKAAYVSCFTGEPMSVFDYEVRSATAQSQISQSDADFLAQSAATQAVQLALPCV